MTISKNNNKLNLLLFFTFNYTLSKWAKKGHLQREALLYNQLAESGIKITFVTYGNHEDYKWKIFFHPDIEILPVFTKLSPSKNNFINYFKSILIPFIFKKKFQDCDIIKTNQLWGGWVPVLVKWIYKKPLIVRCGYEYLKFAIFQNKPIIKIRLIKFISRLIYGNADKIIVSSSADKDFINKTFKNLNSSIIVKNNWIDTEVFYPKIVKEQKNRILFVGRLNKQKNVPLLFNAIKDLKIGLDVIGDGELKNELFQLAKKNNIDVNFFGRVPNSDMPSIYNKYPLYVLCSHYEGNPKTLLEAMACGLLVIGTDVTGINNVIVNNDNGYLVKDHLSLRKVINDLLLINMKNKTLSKNARLYIKKNCSLNEYTFSEIQIYNELIIN